MKTVYLLPLITIFMIGSVAILAFRAKYRRGYGPFWLGMTTIPIVLVGKFLLNWSWLTYAGLGLLMVASVWNALPRKKVEPEKKTCPCCSPEQ